MTKPDVQLNQDMRVLGAAFRAGVRRLVLVRILWIALAAALLLVLADAVLALPSWLRGLLALSYLPALVVAAVLMVRRATAAQSFERMVARALEATDPALDNTLVNALDFQQQLGQAHPGGVPRMLMETEVANAARATTQPGLAARLQRVDLRPDLRALGVLAAGALACLVFLWPVFVAIVPRYLLPGRDHPPFHPTRLHLDPAGATVEYGDSLNVKVTSAGPRPRNLELVLESATGQRVARLPLYESSPDSYLQTVENITADLVYFAAMDGGRSQRYRLQVARAPRVDTVRVRYEYPDYTRLRPDTRFLADQTLRGYAGTRVTLTLTANRPLQGGAVVLGTETNALRVEEDPHSVAASFLLASNTTFEATVVDRDGHPAPHPLAGRVVVLPDLPPEVTLTTPGTDSFATPSARVPLAVEARDDLGVRRIDLYRNLNDTPDFRKTVFEHPGGLTFAHANESFDFADLGVKPGDVVDYYVNVTDTDPVTPHAAASRAYRLMIISEDQYRELLQAQTTAEDLRKKYDDLAAGIQDLADLQKQAAADLAALRERTGAQEPLDEKEQARLADLRARQEALAEEARQLAEQFRNEAKAEGAFDVELDFKKVIAKFAGQIDQAAGLMNGSAGAMNEGGQASERTAREAALAHAANLQRQALEQLGESADDYKEGVGQAGREIEEVFALSEDIEHFKYLLERQKGLERQSRYLADVRDPSLEDRVRLKEMAEEQAAVRQELIDLRRALEEHGAQVKEHYPKVAADAQEIADTIGELDIAGQMGQASDAFQRSDGLEGHRSAKAAHEAMLSMVSQCNGSSGEKECEMRLRIAMNTALGNTFQQLARSLNFGEGEGGEGSGMGHGRSGRGGGGQMAYNIYGNAELKNATRRSSSQGKRPRDLPPEAGAASDLATDTEEITVSKDADLKTDGRSEEGVMTEYERLISEYFRRMAEE